MKISDGFKRFAAGLLVLAVLFGVVPTGVFAAHLLDPGELGNNPYMWELTKARSTLALDGLAGSGTAEEPYLIETAEDMLEFSAQVSGGESYEGKYLKLTEDIILPSGWSGVGPTSYSGSKGADLTAFSGTFDGGNHTITIPSGGKGLFNYLREATIQNLEVQGAYIDSCALLNNYIEDWGADGSKTQGTSGSYEAGIPDTAEFNNVHIVGNTKIRSSGFVSGYASGSNTVTITDCSVGSGVTLGCDASGTSLDQEAVGSFGGEFNGIIRNSSSAATVLGSSHIGGLVGGKGQAMGYFRIENATFSGTVQASGSYAGGIAGSGYIGSAQFAVSSAPNTPGVSITGCYVTGTVTGKHRVGGIFGGEEGQTQAWENGIGYIQNNSFAGTVATNAESGKHIGGIIGYMNSLNKYNVISGNTFRTGSAEKGIATVKYVDTSCAAHETASGTTYFNTADKLPSVSGVTKEDHNRTDDPVGEDTDNLASDGTMQTLSVTGYRSTYFRGDAFTLDGAVIKVRWSNRHETSVSPALVAHSGFDADAAGKQEVTLSYNGLTCKIEVTVTAGTVTGLHITNNYKSEYLYGDALDLSGTVITATWQYGSDTTLTPSDITTDYDPHEIGNQEVSLSFGGKSCKINVLVENYVKAIAVSNYKDTYSIDGRFTLSGADIKATWADGSHSALTESDITPSGFSSSSAGTKNVTLTYYDEPSGKNISTTITVTIVSDENITVTFTLLGDSAHGSSGTTHTLASGNLTTWISAATYTIPKDSVVKVLFEKALTAHGITWSNPSGNYVTSITRSGVTLAEFTNGKNSGWMYTLNGSYPDYGIAEQKLSDGDKVVWHYTDDYSREDGRNGTTAPSGSISGTGFVTGTAGASTAADVIKLIDTIGDIITEESKEAIEAARAAYEKLSKEDKEKVTNYDKLLEAEKKLDELLNVAPISEQTILSTGDYLFNTVKSPVVGPVGGEWAVLGLARAEYPVTKEYFDNYYANVERYVRDCNGILHDKKYTDYSRVIIALTAIGKDPRDVAGYDLIAPLADFEQVCWQGINGPIWALIALDSANYPVPDAISGKTRTSRTALIQHILDNELPGGGWSLGDTADVDLTAMAIQALSPYYDTNPDVKSAIERGLTLLSTKQSDRGGFSNGSEMNAESCAQVIVALSALGIDPEQDERFIKNGRSVLDALNDFAVDGGGFKHVLDGEVNGMATEQAYFAIVAYERMKAGKSRLYDMTDIQDYGGDPEEVEPVVVPEKPEEAPASEMNNFPWWAVILIGVCGAAGITLFIFRKKLFDEPLD